MERSAPEACNNQIKVAQRLMLKVGGHDDDEDSLDAEKNIKMKMRPVTLWVQKVQNAREWDMDEAGGTPTTTWVDSTMQDGKNALRELMTALAMAKIVDQDYLKKLRQQTENVRAVAEGRAPQNVK